MSNSCASSSEYPSILTSVHSEDKKNICKPCRCVSNYSSFESSSSEFPCLPPEQVQKLDYEKFKKILQQPSSRSGKNLYDHLVEVIKRIIDERPINVIDYFEQFSRNIRKTKLSVNGDVYKEPQFLEIAKSIIEFIKPLNIAEEFVYNEEFENFGESDMTIYQSSDSLHMKIPRNLKEWGNVFQIHHFWGFCGLGFDIDEVFHLSLSIQKIQLHQYVKNARFWGRIFGLKGTYYVVETILTEIETENRFKVKKAKLLDEMKLFISRREQNISSDIFDPELIPGSKWENYPEEELKKMHHLTKPIPKLQFDEKFYGPEDPLGFGLNRKTYFVTTSLSDEWQELPTVMPEHIRASRKIRKYLTGDLDASLDCYPLFPGTEKNYLRAMIARITSGTYIAPKGFYRRMTRKERKLDNESEDFEEEELEPEMEDNLDNDCMITQNIDYAHQPLKELTLPNSWVHVRPNILDQGRIIHVDEEQAIKDLERKAILSMNGSTVIMYEELGENEFESENLQEEEFKEERENILPELGAELFAPCNEDRNSDGDPAWTSRYSSTYNKINQMIIMRSNLWPGAYSIAYENFCDSIYIGWGLKYVSRCTSLQDVPVIQDLDCADDVLEVNDPTVEMEEKWRQYHLKKEASLNDEMSDISVEVDFDDEDD